MDSRLWSEGYLVDPQQVHYGLWVADYNHVNGGNITCQQQLI